MITLAAVVYILGLPVARSDCADRPWRQVWQKVAFWPLFGIFLWFAIATYFIAPNRFRQASNSSGGPMMAERIHQLVAKPGQLRAGWGRPVPGEAPDLVYAWGAGGADKADGRILVSAFEDCENCFGRSLRQELEHRGYDISTLKFSISQKEG